MGKHMRDRQMSLVRAFKTGDTDVILGAMNRVCAGFTAEQLAELHQAKSESNETLLMIALTTKTPSVSFIKDLIGLLAHHHPQTFNETNDRNETVLHYLARHTELSAEDIDTLLALIYQNAIHAPHLNKQNTDQMTALDIAASNLNGKVFALLCAHAKQAYQNLAVLATNVIANTGLEPYITVNSCPFHIFWMEKDDPSLDYAYATLQRENGLLSSWKQLISSSFAPTAVETRFVDFLREVMRTEMTLHSPRHAAYKRYIDLIEQAKLKPAVKADETLQPEAKPAEGAADTTPEANEAPQASAGEAEATAETSGVVERGFFSKAAAVTVTAAVVAAIVYDASRSGP